MNRLNDVIYSVFFVLCSINVSASDEVGDLFELSFEDLLKVKISVASNVTNDVRKQPVSVSTITKTKIELSGARTLSELLTIFVPGYFMVEDQDDSIASFRGLVPDNNSKVMLLLNGENLNTEWFWGPPDAILNGIDMGYVERIEVIRGPGSVTLGQGALLGVINIVTQSGTSTQTDLSFSTGADGLSRKSFITQHSSEDTKAWLYFATGSYQGTPLDNRGWASARSDQGLSIFERNHRLHRSDFTNYVVNVKHDKIEANLFHFEQRRDLYNFFRDREAVEQRLDGFSLKYSDDIFDKLKMTLSAKYIIDDYALFSHGNNIETTGRFDYESTGSGFTSIIDGISGLADMTVQPGLVMGGTRERRIGFKALFNYDFSENNRIAFGFERNSYKSGLKDRRGNNFIINEEIQTLGLASDGAGGFNVDGTVNENNAWVKPGDFEIDSLFAEDFWSLDESWDIFAAVRWDDHPNWGSQISPRVGALYAIDKKNLFRVTWQTGFRGAVGVQFAGGFVQDGLLAEENFEFINGFANTVVDFNFDGDGSNDNGQLNPVTPETIESFELAYSYTSDILRFNGVIFFNIVEDILAAQAHGYEGLAFGDQVGTDDIGTWNGNWYYQNQDGQLKQFGYELEVDYVVEDWILSASHSHVEVSNADPGTIGVYVLDGDKTAAYPEDVTRMHASFRAESSMGLFNLNINALYYWEYNAPTGTTVDGAHILNAGISLKPTAAPNLNLSLILKNLTNADSLYPVNGTGNLEGADGTPTIESRSWWLTASYKF